MDGVIKNEEISSLQEHSSAKNDSTSVGTFIQHQISHFHFHFMVVGPFIRMMKIQSKCFKLWQNLGY